MPLRPRAPRGGAEGRRRLRGAGERDRPRERSGCVDTARPCPRALPSALPSAGMWLPSGLCWRRRPLLCPERQLMQYRSPIVKRPLLPARLPQIVAALATLETQTHLLRAPQMPEHPGCDDFYSCKPVTRLAAAEETRARLAPLPLTGECGSAPGGHEAPAPRTPPRPEGGRPPSPPTIPLVGRG